MNTVMVWLLIAYGYAGGSGGAAPTALTVERFPTRGECERVQQVLGSGEGRIWRTRCIQATVVR